MEIESFLSSFERTKYLKECLWCVITLEDFFQPYGYECHAFLSSLILLLSLFFDFTGETEGKLHPSEGLVVLCLCRFDQSTLLCSSDFVLEHAYCWFYLVHFQHSLRVQRCMIKSARMTLESDSKIPQFIAVFAQLRSQRVFFILLSRRNKIV